ncbi:MAG TPA: hypothetical protein PLL89_00960, partial [bacterium]|nr:hypothetical protein [bacterium]
MKIIKEYLKLRRYVFIQQGYFWAGLFTSILSTLFNAGSLTTVVPLIDRIFAGKPIIMPESIPD